MMTYLSHFNEAEFCMSFNVLLTLLCFNFGPILCIEFVFKFTTAMQFMNVDELHRHMRIMIDVAYL